MDGLLSPSLEAIGPPDDSLLGPYSCGSPLLYFCTYHTLSHLSVSVLSGVSKSSSLHGDMFLNFHFFGSHINTFKISVVSLEKVVFGRIVFTYSPPSLTSHRFAMCMMSYF